MTQVQQSGQVTCSVDTRYQLSDIGGELLDSKHVRYSSLATLELSAIARPVIFFPRRYTYAVRFRLACSDFGTESTFPRSDSGTTLYSVRSSVLTPEIYAGMATGRAAGAPPSPGLRQPLTALLALINYLPPATSISLRATFLFYLLVTSRGVMEYLFWAKEQEQDPWLKDDIAVAIRTCVLAAEGCKDPNVVATYEILGCHPDHLQQLIEARRRALLGDLYEAWYGNGAAGSNSSDPLPPRKQPSPVILPQKAKGEAA